MSEASSAPDKPSINSLDTKNISVLTVEPNCEAITICLTKPRSFDDSDTIITRAAEPITVLLSFIKSCISILFPPCIRNYALPIPEEQ